MPAAPAEVVLRSLHVVYERNAEAASVDAIAAHGELARGVVLTALLELRDQRLARPVRKHPGLWLPWDSDNVSLGLALEILRGLPGGEVCDER